MMSITLIVSKVAYNINYIQIVKMNSLFRETLC
jgi:hypothetical protein